MQVLVAAPPCPWQRLLQCHAAKNKAAQHDGHGGWYSVRQPECRWLDVDQGLAGLVARMSAWGDSKVLWLQDLGR